MFCFLHNTVFIHSFSYLLSIYCVPWASQMALVVKKLPANAGDAREVDSIPRLGNPLEEKKSLLFSCLENPMDRGA